MTTDMEYLIRINDMIREMQEIVESSADQVHDALVNKKTGTKSQIYELAKSTQIKEEEVLEMCVQSLIRYQPLASDLRVVTVAMKVAYDLSRVSRYLYNIVEMQNEFNIRDCEYAGVISLFDDGREMVSRALKAYFDRDARTAKDICASDDSIDNRYRAILSQYKAQSVFNGDCILFNGLTARIIERMADHACYISHEVIYLVTGRRTYFR